MVEHKKSLMAHIKSANEIDCEICSVYMVKALRQGKWFPTSPKSSMKGDQHYMMNNKETRMLLKMSNT